MNCNCKILKQKYIDGFGAKNNFYKLFRFLIDKTTEGIIYDSSNLEKSFDKKDIIEDTENIEDNEDTEDTEDRQLHLFDEQE